MTIRRLGWVLWLVSWLASPAWGEEPAVTISRAELVRHDGGHWLDADIKYRLSDPANDALHNGVPLAFALKLLIYDEPRRWWSPPIASERHWFRVRYHSLAKLFQWTQDDKSSPDGFATLGALLEELGTVRQLPVAAKLTPGGHYEVQLMVSLDIEALPLPLRPVAYLTPSWYLSSPWYTWPFVD